jgi:hypothetical protein
METSCRYTIVTPVSLSLFRFQSLTRPSSFSRFYQQQQRKQQPQWKIAHHHSSQMPEEVEPKSARQTLSEQEARNLFNLWNDALATGDPAKVAARYAKEAILLPTVSDVPRTDKESITEYFGTSQLSSNVFFLLLYSY